MRHTLGYKQRTLPKAGEGIVSDLGKVDSTGPGCLNRKALLADRGPDRPPALVTERRKGGYFLGWTSAFWG